MPDSMKRVRFQFVPMGVRAPEGSVSVDGLVPGAGLHLSHWAGNRTPAEYQDDTSTGIALRYVEMHGAEHPPGRRLVNNHFDTDGVLAVWTLLEPEAALARRNLLTAAAEAGDFAEWPADRRGLLVDAAILKIGEAAGSEVSAYRKVLGQLPHLLDAIEDRRELWQEAWGRIETDLARVGAGRLETSRAGRVGIVRHGLGEDEVSGPVLARLFQPRAWRYLLAFELGAGLWSYRYELPRHAWAVTVKRPMLDAPDATTLAQRLGPGFAPVAREPGGTGLVATTSPLPLDPEVLQDRLAALDPAPWADTSFPGHVPS
jgi:hypothetical protein